MLLKNVKFQFLLVAGVSALFGYAAAYGKLNPFQKADAGPVEPAKATTSAPPTAPECCSDGVNKAGLVALANHNEAVADKAAKDGKKPNIVLVLMDNLGYGEIGCYGGGILRGAPTPHIDKLAADGARLLNFNVEAQCTPSRAALMTGRYAVRTGILPSLSTRLSTG